MKKLFIILAFAKASLAWSQPVAAPNVRASITLDRMNDNLGITPVGPALYGIPLPAAEVIGEGYLDTAWSRSSILLYSSEKTYNHPAARFDVLNNGLEVKMQDKTLMVPGDKLKGFLLTNGKSSRAFVNAREFEASSVGFYEVLSTGKLTLLKRYEARLKSSTYVPAFDLGSRNAKILKSESYFYADERGVVELEKKKKKLSRQLEHLGIGNGKVRMGNLAEEELILLFNNFNVKK
jgi:hypothetical protein